MRRMALVVATAGLMWVGPSAPVHADGGSAVPPHGHMLVLGVEFGPTGPTFRKCVDIAAGRALPLHAHHEHLHTGQAGEALRAAGNFAIPTSPLSSFANCAALEAMVGR